MKPVSQETRFTALCIENYKKHRAMTGREVSKLFAKFDVYEYLRDFYDILHTTSPRYINEDLDIYLRARGDRARR